MPAASNMPAASAMPTMRMRPVRALVVDDSALVRDLLSRGLSLDPGIEVVGQAADVYEARDRIVALAPDVLTLDVNMPGMDGIEFLRRLLPQYPIPVIVVSAFTAEGSRLGLAALEAGAVDVVAKPSATDPGGLRDMLLDLAARVREAGRMDRAKLGRPGGPGVPSGPGTAAGRGAGRTNAPPGANDVAQRLKAARSGPGSDVAPLPPKPSSCVVAIGASTGGVNALGAIVPLLPSTCPPVVIVQHMPAVFTRLFAESLDKASQVEVREARDGDGLAPGLVLVAPGDLQLRVVRESPGLYRVRCAPGPKVSGHRPSVDVLFGSVAEAAGQRAAGLLLTGMGRDGADGLLAMRRTGARCLAQDEESSVVFGMPREAWINGAAERLVPLDRAAAELMDLAAAERRAASGGGTQ
jgi:two-component system chemotaxis response regulator CheB